MADRSRRDVLGATTAAGLAGLAGCLDALVEASDGSGSDDDGRECIQCVGSLEYEVTVELSDDTVEAVEVDNGDDDEREPVEVG